MSTIMNTGPSSYSSPPPPKKESSFIVNLILIFFGLTALLKGIFDLLIWMKILTIPEWMQSLYEYTASRSAGNIFHVLGIEEIVNTMLGFWALITGLSLFRHNRSSWGMALVILSTQAGISLYRVINWFSVPDSFDIMFWPNWIVMVSGLLALLGFFWLLLTRKSYS
ncbi:MAG: hypothetical protein JW969_20885 [Spirochaetales bacterium]|nr:hypothetical protein [Spirochaetales bacterium]